MAVSVVVRLELAQIREAPRIAVREDSHGAVVYMTLVAPESQLSFCIRHPRQAKQLQKALDRVVAELNEVAAFT